MSTRRSGNHRVCGQEKEREGRSVVSDAVRPHELQPTRLLCPFMECTVRRSLQARILGCLFLLQGIFLTQGSNPVLPRCRWTQSHLVDKDQRSTWTLDTGHGDRPLPGSAGPRSDVQGEAEFTGRLSRGLPGPGQRFLVAGAWADFLGGAAGQQWAVDSDLGRGRPALRVPSPCRRHRHADPQDCSPLDSASGQQLPGSAGAETPAGPIPYQHHPAQGQL